MHQINTALCRVQQQMVAELHVNGGGLLYSIWADRQVPDVSLRPSDHPDEEEHFFKSTEDRWCDFFGLCRWTFPTQGSPAQQLMTTGLDHLASFVFHRQDHPGAPPSTHWPLPPM